MSIKRLFVPIPVVFCVVGVFLAYGASPAASLKNRARVFDDADASSIRLVRAEEVRNTLSYRNNSGTLTSANKHVLKLIFKIVGTNVVSTSGGLGSMPEGTTGSTTSSTTSTTGVSTTGLGTTGVSTTTGLSTASVVPSPEGDDTAVGTDGGLPPPTTTTSLTTGSTGSTTGTTGAPTPETTVGFYLWVQNPAEMGPIGTRAPMLTPSLDETQGVPGGLGIKINPGEEAAVHLASTGALSSGSVTVTVEITTSIHYFDDPSTTTVNEEHWTYSSAYKKITYDITKYLCNDSSVDTRKAYGTPNREGDLPDDPNADPAELNFNNWVWRGGDFVGNLPWQTRDLSGCARTQLYPQTSNRTTAPRLATLTMFYRGALASANGGVTLGAYVPGSSDANLNSSASTVTWPTRWDIQPRTSPGTPRDPSKDPLYQLAFTSNTLAGEYANWQLTDTTDSTSATPSTVFKGVGVAITNESDYLTNSYSAWRYFASAEYPSIYTTFPETDSMPRLWVVDINSATNWTYVWTGGGWW